MGIKETDSVSLTASSQSELVFVGGVTSARSSFLQVTSFIGGASIPSLDYIDPLKIFNPGESIKAKPRAAGISQNMQMEPVQRLNQGLSSDVPAALSPNV